MILCPPSPNHNARKTAIDMLVIHYTGMTDGAATLDRLCDPASECSAHYVIDLDGKIYGLVAEANRAWHAGRAAWRYQDQNQPCPFPSDINSRSIGIELVNLGHEFGYHPYPPTQIAALIGLCQDILRRHPAILPRQVLGHSDIAPRRKQDPGELFPWPELAAQGIGIFPSLVNSSLVNSSLVNSSLVNPSLVNPFLANPYVTRDILLRPGDSSAAVENLQRRLALYGYEIDPTGIYDLHHFAVITAWQRHFRPQICDGLWDSECDALLTELCRLAGESMS
ncbi:MAG: N-acetylmuramoyl-L-alanine amidase [Candidatus Symbiobacter sp.]|nr:N-acetylmuramoyl-L-alanine amidase [Candidatus Symbiobacter sp.]